MKIIYLNHFKYHHETTKVKFLINHKKINKKYKTLIFKKKRMIKKVKMKLQNNNHKSKYL
jgi:hypothetical protein